MEGWKCVALSGVVGFLLAVGLAVIYVLVMLAKTRKCPKEEAGTRSRDASLEGVKRRRSIDDILDRVRRIGAREAESPSALERNLMPAYHSMLALSGGGLYGAFGAGVLKGWWERGRPKFDVVTGISTGALQAPFVFVHTEEAEKALAATYSNVSASDIVEKRWAPTVPLSSSFAKTERLKALIKRKVTDDLIEQVAAEGGSGRGLFVGTANFDSGELEIWDMGEVAKAEEYDRFRDILLASAAIPASLPPVFIDGRLHMDGGTREQIFVPCVVQALHEGFHEGRTRAGNEAVPQDQAEPPRAYFIVNGEIGLYRHCTQPRLLDIAMRAIDLLSDEARVGNLWKCWGHVVRAIQPDDLELKKKKRAACFNLISMPHDLLGGPKSSIELTSEDSATIYAKGLEMGRKANTPEGWLHSPEDLPHPQGHP